MLNTVFKDAIINREKTLSILKGPEYDKIIQKAKENWIDYKPEKQEVVSAGIDSSFNSTKFQGAELWAVTAVSIKTDGEIIADLHDFGLDTNPVLASLASKMEIDACNMSIDNADLVLMDGSLYSQFMTRQASLTESMVKAMKRRNNVIFISKTSNTRKQFEDSKFGKDKIITSIFARLADSLPLIKVELFGTGYTNEDFKQVLNKIYKNSISGYPYSLKLAHNNCKISGKDLAKLASIYGLANEIGSREVLG